MIADKNMLFKRITEVSDEITRLKNIVCSLAMTDIQRFPENYEIMSTEAAIRGEKIACGLRHIIYSTTNIKKTELMAKTAEAHEIEIKYADGIFMVTLPALLPKRRSQKNTEFLTDPLYCALDKYTNANHIEKYRECVVCFSHIYSVESSGRRVRDYDNIELKQILDVISAYIMIDDGSYFCDLYNTIETGIKDCTCVSVMNKNRFPAWLSKRQKDIKSMSENH